MIKAAKMSFIGSPEKSDQNQKLQHKTRVGSHALRTAMHPHPERPACQREPARPPSWCSKSYGAAPAAWGIDASPAWVSIERGRAGFPKKRYLARLARYPCAARGRAVLDFIPRIYRRAGARILTLKFCFHGFNHGLPFVYCDRTDCPRMATIWPCTENLDILTIRAARPAVGRVPLIARHCTSTIARSGQRIPFFIKFN